MQYGPVGAFPLTNKIVLITGGGSGIGFEFARLTHAAGASVLIGDLGLTPEASAWIATLGAESSRTHFQETDVLEWQKMHHLITVSVQVFGSVPDVYAPVAGVFEPAWSNFWDDSEFSSGMYKTIAINVNHPIQLTRLAIRALAGAKKKGVVVLVASTAGVRGNYLGCLYSASKHAVVGFAKSMGIGDMEEGVKVVAVCPGVVATRLWTDREPEFLATNKYAERPALLPADIATVMVKMVESGEYSGGTVMLKTPLEERVLEVGYDKQGGLYDPSPRPAADLGRIKRVIDGERGVEWKGLGE